MHRISQSHVRGLAALLALAMLGVNVAAQAPRESKTSALPRSAAAPKESSTLLEVAGEVAHPRSWTRAEFAKLPRRTVRAKGHDGVESQYEGVPLIEILAQAGVPTGKELRGKALSLYVVVEAADSYRAVFALSELDSEFTDRVILLADRRDEKALPVQAGAFQVIVPGEKKHARWVRQVIRIRVGRG